MKLTFYGHATFQVEMNGKILLFDPFISPNPKATQVNVDAIRADYILLSHGHGDHVADAERIAKNNNARIISCFEIVSWFENKGIHGHPMNHGGKWKFDFGTVKYVYATHSSVLPDGSYGGNPGGFVIWNEEKCFYFAGDTALSQDMQLIPRTCPPLDFAILPIGDNFTMGYEDACIAADFIACKKIVGMHFDTFPYIEIDKTTAMEHFRQHGKTLLLPSIGETIQM